ncbi:MAG: hypothetical protein AB7J19_04090, partial [Beijerinckiaceae bacterium]
APLEDMSPTTTFVTVPEPLTTVAGRRSFFLSPRRRFGMLRMFGPDVAALARTDGPAYTHNREIFLKNLAFMN